MTKTPSRKIPRGVSDEEDFLFREVLKDARPLRRIGAGKAAKSHQALPAGKRQTAVAKPEAPLPKKAPPAPESDEPPAIGGHREAHLRRGRLEPEARLDLHGFTQDEAYRALQRFLMRARDANFSLVLVITGKGGVLREQVPRWLAQTEMRALTTGASPAHIRHGGGGALYVAVKKKKKS